MEDSTRPPPTDRVAELLKQNARDEALDVLNTVQQAGEADRKATLRSLRRLAEEHPETVGDISPELAPFLTDDERSIRLTTAKLFVAVGEAEPDAVVPVVSALADRLADEEEFYYVRARVAEALGYVALDRPGEVSDPGILADFRIGLSFDEPEVKEKLAKALEYVALGDPGRLQYQVSKLAGHVDDESELVRYHLCTALVVIGSEYPEQLADAADALRERLSDESPYVRGRAAEALAILAQSGVAVGSIPALDGDDSSVEDGSPFLSERLAFLRRCLDEGERSEAAGVEVGTIESVRASTDDAVEEIITPNGAECSHCGLALPEEGPPMCPRCGAPR